MKLILVAVFFWIGNQDLNPLAQTDVPVQECSSDISKRLDCGWWGISQQDCDVMLLDLPDSNAVGGVLAAKHAKIAAVAMEMPGVHQVAITMQHLVYCNVRMGDRKDCGYSGITAEKCEENMSCCYGAASRGPWCYYDGTLLEDGTFIEFKNRNAASHSVVPSHCQYNQDYNSSSFYRCRFCLQGNLNELTPKVDALPSSNVTGYLVE
eukprot:gene16406-7812_t